MSKARIEIKVSDDKKTVQITFSPETGVSGTVTLTQEHLSLWIRGFGAAHKQMSDGRPLPQLEGQHIEAIYNTRWYIQPEPLTEGSSISFQHPAFGPVGFVIPLDQVKYMVELLSVHLQSLPQSRGLPN